MILVHKIESKKAGSRKKEVILYVWIHLWLIFQYLIVSHFQSNNNDRLFLIAKLQKLELL